MAWFDDLVSIKGFTPKFRASEFKASQSHRLMVHFPYCEKSGKHIRQNVYMSRSDVDELAFIRAQKDTIERKLALGYFIPAKTVGIMSVKTGAEIPLTDAVHDYLRFKHSTVHGKNNLEAFFVGQLLPFVEKHWKGLMLADLDKGRVAYLLSEMQIEYEWKNQTRNMRKNLLYNFFEYFIEKDAIEVNPSKKISRLKEKHIEHYLPFMTAQANALEAHMKANNPQMLLFVKFIYFTFMRPWQELRNAKVSHIDIKNRMMFIPHEHSKSKKSEYVFLPQKLIDLIEERKLLSYPKSSYLFSKDGVPGKTPIAANTLRDHHKRILKLFGLDTTHHLYSWKPTGVCAMYRKCRDIKAVQRQCRHSDIQTTDIYLSQLGLYNDEFKVDFE